MAPSAPHSPLFPPVSAIVLSIPPHLLPYLHGAPPSIPPLLPPLPLLLPLLFVVFFPLLSALSLLIAFDHQRPLRLLRSLSPPQPWASLLILAATGIFPHLSVFLPSAPLPLSSSDLRPLPPQLHRPRSATTSSTTTIVDLRLNLPTSPALLPPLLVAVIVSGIVLHHGHRLNHRDPPSLLLHLLSSVPISDCASLHRPSLPFLCFSLLVAERHRPPSPHFHALPFPLHLAAVACLSLFFVTAATVTPPPSPPSSSSAFVTDHPSLLPLRHSLSVVVLPTIFAPFPCFLSALSSF